MRIMKLKVLYIIYTRPLIGFWTKVLVPWNQMNGNQLAFLHLNSAKHNKPPSPM